MYKLKSNQESFEIVDGPYAGKKYKAGQVYEDIPPQEKHRFERVAQSAKRIAQGAKSGAQSAESKERSAERREQSAESKASKEITLNQKSKP